MWKIVYASYIITSELTSRIFSTCMQSLVTSASVTSGSPSSWFRCVRYSRMNCRRYVSLGYWSKLDDCMSEKWRSDEWINEGLICQKLSENHRTRYFLVCPDVRIYLGVLASWCRPFTPRFQRKSCESPAYQKAKLMTNLEGYGSTMIYPFGCNSFQRSRNQWM